MTTLPAAPVVDAASMAGLDCRDLPDDPATCPYGLAHVNGSPGCAQFRRAAVAKGLRAPRGGWACQTEPASTDRRATEEFSSVAATVRRPG